MHESSMKSTIGGTSIGKISNDNFENIKVIGRGSFGKVYLVKKKDSGEFFAMKILKKDELILKDLLEKTTAERDILQ
jgi:serum/glucocorticoid-regulated kinase 2